MPLICHSSAWPQLSGCSLSLSLSSTKQRALTPIPSSDLSIRWDLFQGNACNFLMFCMFPWVFSTACDLKFCRVSGFLIYNFCGSDSKDVDLIAWCSAIVINLENDEPLVSWNIFFFLLSDLGLSWDFDYGSDVTQTFYIGFDWAKFVWQAAEFWQMWSFYLIY